MFKELNGFYAGFFSGAEDNGLAVFVFRNGRVVGADYAGTKFDGGIEGKNEDGTYNCSVEVALPPNGTTVQGAQTGDAGLKYGVQFSLPADFSTRPYFYIETPLGGVNVRLERVRDLGAIDE